MRKKTKQSTEKEKQSFLQKFGLFFFTRTRVTLFAWVLLLIFGISAYTTWLPREGFPNISAPYATVNGTYFVNDQEKIDADITQPFSETIQDVDGVKMVNSNASDNFFSIQIEFEESVNPEEGSNRVKDAVTSAHQIPKGADVQFSPLYVASLTTEGDDLLIAVTAKDDLSTTELDERAKLVAQALGKDGAEAITGAERVKASELFQEGENPQTGEKVIQQKSFDWVASPEVKEGDFQQSAIVAVKANDTVDDLALYDETAEKIAALQQKPEFSDVKITIAADLATSVRSQVDSLQMNLFSGLVAVFIVTLLFISWRASIVTAISMVTVLILTVGALWTIGDTLNTITLFSLILCLGLIVDDTTIMIEAIDKRRRAGQRQAAAVSAAIKKIATASIAGTLTTILAFAPLLFIGGIMGDFIKAIPVTIILSLTISLIVSMSLVPFLARFTVLRSKIGGQKFTNPINTLETKTANGLAALIRIAARSRIKGAFIGLTAIGISIAMMFGAMAIGGKLPFNIFPSTKDGDALSVNMSFPEGTTIDVAKEYSKEVNIIVEETIGEYVTRASYQGSGSTGQARLAVDLKPHQNREPTSAELVEKVQSKLDQIDGIEAKAMADGGPAPTDAFTMQIRSEDGQALHDVSNVIQAFLEDYQPKRADGTTAKTKDVKISGLGAITRTDGERHVQIDASYDAEDTSALVAATQTALKEKFDDKELKKYGLSSENLVFDVGQEAESQDSFQSMMIAFPILLLAMYILLAVQFRSLSQAFMIFLAIPFSLFGVTAGLYFTDNAFSFFVMLGIFALMGIAVNNTILLTDYANQARRAGKGRVEAIADALHERFRPLLVTSLTTVVALVPLMLSDPFWEALAATLVFGLLASTFLVIIAFPYYYLANELFRMYLSRKIVISWLIGALLILLVLPQLGVDSTLSSMILVGYLALSFIALVIRIIRRRRRA